MGFINETETDNAQHSTTYSKTFYDQHNRVDMKFE